jgi:transketolase
VIKGINGNDVEAIDSAIEQAKNDPRPSIIVCRTHIGYGLPTRQDTPKAHGEPPGEEELSGAKARLNWPQEPLFNVPDDVLEHFREALERGVRWEAEWESRMDAYRESFPEQAAEFERRLRGELPVNWDGELPVFQPDPKGMATRASSGKVLNVLAKFLPELVGGSADLAPSNKTWIDGSPSFQSGTPVGRNFHFGVREHAMGAVVNGMAVHGGVIPYGGTFLVFSDYMRPAIRIAALSDYPSIWVFTHDSIGLGEDGPTHQPVEQLAALRAIPNLVVIRPADANEVTEAWKSAISRRDGPSLLILSRQNVPTFDRKIYASADGLHRGAYVMADIGSTEPDLILMATGSEVGLIVEAGLKLTEDGISVRIVSFPSWEMFASQEKEYRDSVLLPEVGARLSVEAGVSQGWERWVGDKGATISIDRFGSSAPYLEIYANYGLSVDNIVAKAKELII